VTRIHETALERKPEARDLFLAKTCDEDTELRREVESLLVYEDTLVLIDSPVWDLAVEVLDAEPILAAGTRVGPYRIEGVLGTGGMG
jgi:hypothetical protein